MDELQPRQIAEAGESPQSKRPMRRAELMGAHSHLTTNHVTVHVYQRDGKFLARGRYQKQAFGETLGADERQATSRLRHLLTEIDKGTYVRPSETKRRPMNDGVVRQFDLRALTNEFLAEKRKTRGARTSHDYRNRLAPILDFAELQTSRQRWGLAQEIDREFVLDLHKFLMNRDVTRNGRPGGIPKPMSFGQVRNCLETLRTMLAWAVRADIRKLPPEFVNPVSHDIIGPKQRKDPLRKAKLPMSRRIEMIKAMDEWQVLHLAILIVLPLRFEDVAGALISDVDFEGCTLHLGTRFHGNDFNKERLEVEMPLPLEFIPILRACAGERREGPLFRSRSVWQGHRKAQLEVTCRQDVEGLLNEALAAAPDEDVQTEQDRKRLFRGLLRRMGGLSESQIGKGIKSLLGNIGVADRTRPYDLRGSVTTDLKTAGVRHLELRYLTLHSVNDILGDYTGLDPVTEMNKYFGYCRPLLQSVLEHACSLGIPWG